MMKYGIDPENEFFIIFVALGELENLIENSPQQWRDLFEQFKEVLEQWAQTNIETLKQLAHKAETTELLAANSEKLSNSLVKLLEVCERLMNQLQESNGLLVNSLSRLQTSETELKNLVEQTQKDLFQLNSLLETLNLSLAQQGNSPVAQKRRAWTWKDSISIGLGAISIVIISFLSIEQSHVSQRVQWLLEKANRQDCLTGVKRRNSPECRHL